MTPYLKIKWARLQLLASQFDFLASRMIFAHAKLFNGYGEFNKIGWEQPLTPEQFDMVLAKTIEKPKPLLDDLFHRAYAALLSLTGAHFDTKVENFRIEGLEFKLANLRESIVEKGAKVTKIDIFKLFCEIFKKDFEEWHVGSEKKMPLLIGAMPIPYAILCGVATIAHLGENWEDTKLAATVTTILAALPLVLWTAGSKLLESFVARSEEYIVCSHEKLEETRSWVAKLEQEAARGPASRAK